MPSLSMKPNKHIEEGFLRLYDQLADSLFRHIYVRVSNREKAVDIVQETFAKLWRHMSLSREIRNEKAFVYRIAHNLIIDEYRRPKDVSLEFLTEEISFDVLDESESSKTVASAELSRVLKAIDSLADRHKEVLLMRYVEELLPQEIAEITGLSENVVSVRLNRAVKKLKEVTGYSNE